MPRLAVRETRETASLLAVLVLVLAPAASVSGCADQQPLQDGSQSLSPPTQSSAGGELPQTGIPSPSGSPLPNPSGTAPWSVVASFGDYRSATTQPFSLRGGEQAFTVWFEEGELVVAVLATSNRTKPVATLTYRQAGLTETTLRLDSGEYVLDVHTTGAWGAEIRERP